MEKNTTAEQGITQKEEKKRKKRQNNKAENMKKKYDRTRDNRKERCKKIK